MPQRIKKLKNLLETAKELKNQFSEESFESWKIRTQHTLERIYGVESKEVEKFDEIRFYPMSFSMDGDNSEYFKKAAFTGISSTIDILNLYIEDLVEDIEIEKTNKSEDLIYNSEYTKIFISHSSEDKDIVENVIDLLEDIGISSNQIFCTSFEGYGIQVGENFLETIKSELNSNVLVLFILSNNFYKSPVCLCEMGATWVKTNKHIPILIPPLEYSEVKGVIPLTQGLKINNPQSLTSFKEVIEKDFKLDPITINTWDRKKERFIKTIDKINKEV